MTMGGKSIWRCGDANGSTATWALLVHVWAEAQTLGPFKGDLPHTQRPEKQRNQRMWYSTYDVVPSPFDGSPIHAMCLQSESGAKVCKGSIFPEGMREITYSSGRIHLKIRLSQYDNDEKPTSLFHVYLNSSIRDHELGGDAIAAIKADLKDALTGWNEILDPNGPRVANLVFK